MREPNTNHYNHIVGYFLFPQEDDIKEFLKEILEEANLEEITMKTVCKKVYAKYPEHDLSHKKDFIKATVKSVSNRV